MRVDTGDPELPGGTEPVCCSPSPDGGVAVYDVPLTRESIADVRAEIGRLLSDGRAPVVTDAQLVATELAANACDHARLPRRLRLRRESRRCGPTLLIEVSDASVDSVPVLGRSSVGTHRGRGMLLVAMLSHRWGVRLDDCRKTVWGLVLVS